jgi:hypothetical protein
MANAREKKATRRSSEGGGPHAAAAVPGALPYERIAARAYQIWLEAGCPDGRDEEHWYQAERELRDPRPAPRAPLR